jgi:hypothetical protein
LLTRKFIKNNKLPFHHNFIHTFAECQHIFTFSCFIWPNVKKFPIRSRKYLRSEIKQRGRAIRKGRHQHELKTHLFVCEVAEWRRRAEAAAWDARSPALLQGLTDSLTHPRRMEGYVCATLRASLLRQSVATTSNHTAPSPSRQPHKRGG